MFALKWAFVEADELWHEEDGAAGPIRSARIWQVGTAYQIIRRTAVVAGSVVGAEPKTFSVLIAKQFDQTVQIQHCKREKKGKILKHRWVNGFDCWNEHMCSGASGNKYA